jgi:hypothetical protein
MYLGHVIQFSSQTFARLSSALLFVVTLSVSYSAIQNFAHAQSLDVRLDSAISSGVLVGSNAREISVNRSPLTLDIDTAFIIDGDESIEWVLGTLIQTEYTPSYAINPQIRLRRRWKLLEAFAGFGLPFFFTPYTRFGTELSLGVAFPAEGAIALIGHGVLNTYFLGSDLSDGNPVFTMNGVVGLRVRF